MEEKILTKILKLDGQEGENFELNPSIFGVKYDPHTIKLSLDRMLANARNTVAHTKTRAEVAGSKTKVYRQKGTGRARQGQNSAPHRRGGGVAFGPRSNANYTKELPKFLRRFAIFSALSKNFSDGNLRILENITFESPKTSKAYEIVSKISAKSKNLFIVDGENPSVSLSFRNIPNQKVLKANFLNVKDLVEYDKIFITLDGVEKIYATYLKEDVENENRAIKKESKVKKEKLEKEEKSKSEKIQKVKTDKKSAKTKKEDKQ
ncbi:MAG: hypothetical protein Fur0024_1960 [Patescibacteria group bacterium]